MPEPLRGRMHQWSQDCAMVSPCKVNGELGPILIVFLEEKGNRKLVFLLEGIRSSRFGKVIPSRSPFPEPLGNESLAEGIFLPRNPLGTQVIGRLLGMTEFRKLASSLMWNSNSCDVNEGWVSDNKLARHSAASKMECIDRALRAASTRSIDAARSALS